MDWLIDVAGHYSALTLLGIGDSKVLQRIDGSIKTIVERYESEITGHKAEIAELRASLEAIRGTAVDGTARVETVQAALADLAQHADPAKADAILAAIEASATDVAAPHRAEAAEAARHRGALAYLDRHTGRARPLPPRRIP